MEPLTSHDTLRIFNLSLTLCGYDHECRNLVEAREYARKVEADIRAGRASAHHAPPAATIEPQDAVFAPVAARAPRTHRYGRIVKVRK